MSTLLDTYNQLFDLLGKEVELDEHQMMVFKKVMNVNLVFGLSTVVLKSPKMKNLLPAFDHQPSTEEDVKLFLETIEKEPELQSSIEEYVTKTFFDQILELFSDLGPTLTPEKKQSLKVKALALLQEKSVKE